MSSSPSTIEHLMAQLEADLPLEPRKMFGEYGLFLDGKMVGVVCDDLLYVRPTPAGKAFWGECEEGSPYPGAKPHMIIEERELQPADRFAQLLRLTWGEMPKPRPKKAPPVDRCSPVRASKPASKSAPKSAKPAPKSASKPAPKPASKPRKPQA